jgi:hypothetical protein
MNKKILFGLILSIPIQLNALEPVPAPKVLLSGGDTSMSLGQQLNQTLPKAVVQAPAFAPITAAIKTNDFQPEITALNDDIEAFVKKMTPEASKLNTADLSSIYLTYKNTQQVNILLKEQNKVLGKLNQINGNIKVMIEQNNMLLKFMMEQEQRRKMSAASSDSLMR